MKEELLNDELYTAYRKLCWFINGLSMHCLPWSMYNWLTVERICQMYNVDPKFFKK